MASAVVPRRVNMSEPRLRGSVRRAGEFDHAARPFGPLDPEAATDLPGQAPDQAEPGGAAADLAQVEARAVILDQQGESAAGLVQRHPDRSAAVAAGAVFG